MSNRSYTQSPGPGRRFSAGSSRGDHLLGAFGFVSHAFFFTALTAGSCCLWPGMMGIIFCLALAASLAVLIIRGAQVGTTTTVESIKAIKDAWL